MNLQLNFKNCRDSSKPSILLENIRAAKGTFIMAAPHKEGAYFEPQFKPIAEMLPTQIPQNHLLVKITRASICQTDRRVLAQQKPSEINYAKICLGHEGGGIVIDTNSEKKILPGQKVVFLPHFTCRECHHCLSGNTNLCRSMKHMGIHIQGTFSPYVCLPEQCVHPLEESFSDDAIPLIEPLSCIIRAWANFEKTTAGKLKERNKSLVIYGAGPMGVLAGLWGKMNYPNLNIHLVDPNPYRRESVLQSTGIHVLSSYDHQHEFSFVASSHMDAYHQSVESSSDNGFILAFSGINSKDLMRAKNEGEILPLLYEKTHREEMNLPLKNGLTMIGSSGYNLKNIDTAILNLEKNNSYYSQVQNMAVNALGNQVVELLKTNENMELTIQQSQILKLLIRM